MRGGLSEDTLRQLSGLTDVAPVPPHKAALRSTAPAGPGKLAVSAAVAPPAAPSQGQTLMQREMEESKRREEELRNRATAGLALRSSADRPPASLKPAATSPRRHSNNIASAPAPTAAPASPDARATVTKPKAAVAPPAAPAAPKAKAKSPRRAHSESVAGARNEPKPAALRAELVTAQVHTATTTADALPTGAAPLQRSTGAVATTEPASPRKIGKSKKKTKKEPSLQALPATGVVAASTPPPQRPARAPEAAADYIKVARVLEDCSGPGMLTLSKGDIVAVCAEEGGIYSGYTLRDGGRYGTFAADKCLALRSNANAELGRKCFVNSGKGNNDAAQRCALALKRFPLADARHKVVAEMVETELAYYRSLSEILEYRRNIALVPGNLYPIDTLFMNAEAIHTVSAELLRRLADTLEQWDALASKLSWCFLDLGPFFVAYEDYCAGFEQAQQTLSSLSAEAAFSNFLRASQVALPLDALLVMPVQRMPRYKLLLEDLVRKTPDAHGDRSDLVAATQMVTSLAFEINERIRSSETTQALLSDGKDERLARYISRDRAVLMSLLDARVVVSPIKTKLVGKLRADVYVLTDSLLVLLRRTLKADVVWIDEFSHLFWPSRMLWVQRKGTSSCLIGGPLFGIDVKAKRGMAEFTDLLCAEVAKHGGHPADTVRSGAWSILETGVRYDGEWRGDVSGASMNGQGTIELGWGMEYSGTLSLNELTGPGRMRVVGGDVLVGNFVGGVLTGQGTIEYANGDRFRGCFDGAGARSGPGTFESPTLRYTGEWSEDLMHGAGELHCGPGTLFKGLFQRGAFVRGEHVRSDGARLEGTFENYSLHGHCTAVYANGSRFVGEFKLGLRDGSGVLTLADGASLTGTWRADVAHGSAMTWTGSLSHWVSSYVGAYERGLPHGRGTAVYQDGTSFSGLFANGLPEKGQQALGGAATLQGKVGPGLRIVGRAQFSPDGNTETVLDGTVEGATNRLLMRRPLYVPLCLPVARPSVPNVTIL